MSLTDALRTRIAQVVGPPPSPKALRALNDEGYALRQLAQRGVVEPSIVVEPRSTEEIALRERCRETAAQFDRASAELGAAQEDARLLVMESGLVQKITDPWRGDRVRQRLQTAERMMNLAQADDREARLELKRFKLRKRQEQLDAAATRIVERDRQRAANRRAAGLPPLEQGEVWEVPSNVVQHLGRFQGLAR